MKLFWKQSRIKELFLLAKKNGTYLNNFNFYENDILLFGREDKGLPDEIIEKSDSLVSIFMPNLVIPEKNNKGVRSLNLSVACGIALYEAHKQINL